MTTMAKSSYFQYCYFSSDLVQRKLTIRLRMPFRCGNFWAVSSIGILGHFLTEFRNENKLVRFRTKFRTKSSSFFPSCGFIICVKVGSKKCIFLKNDARLGLRFIHSSLFIQDHSLLWYEIVFALIT